MNRTPRQRLLCLCLLLSAAFAAREALAAEHQGLWVGTATLTAVSGVNRGAPDLSFDLAVTGVRTEAVVAARGETWELETSGAPPSAGWQQASGWATGKAPVGRAFTGVQTAVPAAARTAYVRRTFDVPDAASFSSLRLRVWRDDGVAVYLNGEEVFRNNLTSGTLAPETLALTEVTGSTYVEVPIPATHLQTGQNWLAAEVHAASGSDPDLFFDLELGGMLEVPVQEEMVAAAATGWRYLHRDAAPPAGWSDPVFDDSSWTAGQAEIGYGDGGEKTVLPTPSGATLPKAAYFRHRFTPQSLAWGKVRLELLADDGAVVYLNGAEVLRSNMPTGSVAYETPPSRALGASEESRYSVAEVGPETLRAGENVLAVEVHQHPSETGAVSAGTTALQRTPAELPLRLLVHVDGGGTARLLKEVIQMADPATKQPVLLADQSLVPSYTGVTVRDGESVGVRISSVGFDFAGSSWPCGTGVSPSGTLACPEIVLGSDHPTNPFLHRYHPDHDNWDARYEKRLEEAYAVSRTIKLQFSPRYPPNPDLPERVAPPGWGLSVLGGTYRETLKGLHKDEISVAGWFQLERVATTAQLKP